MKIGKLALWTVAVFISMVRSKLTTVTLYRYTM